MNGTTLDWDDFRLFLAVAREGGLAAAADKTGKSAPTLGRRMLALEKRLGTELFSRLPRGYVLTGQGQELLEKVMLLEEGFHPIVTAADSERIRRVKISAGSWVTQLLCSKVSEITGEIPVLLQFISADHVLDIGHREAVIGIRNKRPEQIALAGRATTRIRFAVYAVDESVKTWARTTGSTPSAEWVRNNARGDRFIEVTNSRNAHDLAVHGAARTVLPTFIGNAAPELQQVAEEIKELEHMQWLVTHHEDRHSSEVRQVVDLIYPVLKAIND